MSFVGGVGWKVDEVAHLSKSGADTKAVNLLDLIGVEIGGDVGDHVVVDEVFVTAAEDLGHDVTFLAEMFQGQFGAQIVEAIDLGHGASAGALVLEGGIFVDNTEPIPLELEGYIPAGLDGEGGQFVAKGLHKLHKGCLTTPHGPVEQDPLGEIEPDAQGVDMVTHKPTDEPANDGQIGLQDGETVPVTAFPFLEEVLEGGLVSGVHGSEFKSLRVEKFKSSGFKLYLGFHPKP